MVKIECSRKMFRRSKAMINVENNLDFTQERINVLNKIRSIREHLQLQPAEFFNLVALVSEFADDGTVFPSEWKICEDVLFENLARVYQAGPNRLQDVEQWMMTKLRSDFCGENITNNDRIDLIEDSVESYSRVNCPTRWFRVYMEVYLAITQDTDIPSFSVCSRIMRWMNEEIIVFHGSPPGGG